MLFDLAKKYVLQLKPEFAPVDKKKKLEDSEYIKIIEFIREYEKLAVKDSSHLEQMINDETIDKVFYKNEIFEKYLPLVFIKIGIEALIMIENDIEHANLGRKVFETELQKHLKDNLKQQFNYKGFDIDKLDL